MSAFKALVYVCERSKQCSGLKLWNHCCTFKSGLPFLKQISTSHWMMLSNGNINLLVLTCGEMWRKSFKISPSKWSNHHIKTYDHTVRRLRHLLNLIWLISAWDQELKSNNWFVVFFFHVPQESELLDLMDIIYISIKIIELIFHDLYFV